MAEEKTKKDTITIKKDDLWKYSTFALLAIVILGAIFLFVGEGTTGRVIDNGNNELPSQNARVQASIDDDPVMGDKNAPVTIIEFSDYQCPFCARFWSQTLPFIKSEYIDTGKVKLVYRDFPLDSIHPMATPAAIAAECVREKGGDEAYFEYHDKIFANQQSLSTQNLKLWASEMGFNVDSCIDSAKFRNEVQEDLKDGSEAGVRGTPAFLIGNSKDGYVIVSGAQPSNVFQQIIESELA